MVAPSKFHYGIWAFVMVFQYLCEYKGSKTTLTLFFNFFGVQSGYKSADGSDIISWWKFVKYFEPNSNNVKISRTDFSW